MPRTYPPALRARAEEMARRGLNSYQIARELNVSQPTIYRWINPDKEAAYRAQKMYAVCPICGGPMRARAASCRECRDGIKTLRNEVVRRYLGGQNPWTIALALHREPEWAKDYIQQLKKKGVLPRLGNRG
jgi:predicted transcriptional regulator